MIATHSPQSSTWQSALRAMQQFFWLRPEWWCIVLCAICWQQMLAHAVQHGAHGVHHRMTFTNELLMWMFMVAAMMLPLNLQSIRTAALRSLWNRRHRAIAGFLIGYLAPWLMICVGVVALRGNSWTHTYTAAASCFVVALLWQFTPWQQRAMMACHRTSPLAPLGWRADRDCLRFGWIIGGACVISCWPLMFACALTGHHWLAMTGGMALGIAERWSFRPRTHLMRAGTFLLAGYFFPLA